MFCGFYAILASFRGDFIHAASAILIANIFDGLDGWVARLTNSTTKFGVELDSLSDLVAFGVAPAVLIYSWTLQSFGRIGLGAAFIFVICGALRLARYNVQKETTESKAFTGLPIPAAGTAIASLVLFYTEIWGTNVELNSAILLLPFFLAVLMVTTLRFHSLKELDFKKRKPFWLLVAIVMAILFIIMYPETVIFAFTATYIIWGVIEGTYIIHKKRKYKEII
ncbi:CDP-alcohol phosphatidyltransferase [bacterium BMS3Bbin09]|nr:CDP-alcohol phosphatidyltransferase [bacterium BMS3Bbin09]